MRKKQKEQIKEKFILAFLILFYLEPISFHYLKSLQQKPPNDSLRLKIKNFKKISNKYFSNIVYSEKKITKEKLLLVKNLFFCLESFSIKILNKERINTTHYIIGLEDLLSV